MEQTSVLAPLKYCGVIPYFKLLWQCPPPEKCFKLGVLKPKQVFYLRLLIDFKILYLISTDNIFIQKMWTKHLWGRYFP